MRILLVGEYSGFHNALKHGLQNLGHEVTILGDGDGFKKYPVDINLHSDYYERNWFRRKFKNLIFRIFKRDLRDNLILSRFRESEHLLKDHHIVQFINSNGLGTHPHIERKIISFLIANNKKVFLTACGDDVVYAKYLKHEHKGYSLFDAYEKGHISGKDKSYTLKYLKDAYQQNYQLITVAAETIIPCNTDYLMPLNKDPQASALIPLPVQIHKFDLIQNQNLSTIEIFMGINRHNYWKKGINYFEAALDRIKIKYGDKVNVTIAENLPYSRYIKSYQKAHILLDQVLCYDQGYNALEAMAQGKVVFAGASDFYLKAHNKKQIPVIDAQPDVDYLVQQLSILIDEPLKIIELGKQARKHVLEHHDCEKVAMKYEELYLTGSASISAKQKTA